MTHFQPSRPVPRPTVSGELEQLESDHVAGVAERHDEVILIVENEDGNRMLLEQILEFAGYASISTTNGVEALDVLDRTSVDLVLIDLSMPVLDGYQTTRLIRHRPYGATLPVVAVTAHAMAEDRELALRCGCTDYLSKPYRPSALLNIVERLLHPVPAEPRHR